MDRAKVHTAVQSVVDGTVSGAVVALDAGCGDVAHLTLPPGSTWVGLDVVEPTRADLDERIVADLNEPLELGQRFDMIVCWNVLEHLSNPVVALDTFAGALRPGGVVVIASPSLWSPKGLLTRFTPHPVHEWLYRRLLGSGGHPHETYLRSTMTRRAVTRRLGRQGIDLVWSLKRESPVQAAVRRKLHLPAWLPFRNSDYVAVFRRLDSRNTGPNVPAP
jgi:SAM-dependent methyltransferase